MHNNKEASHTVQDFKLQWFSYKPLYSGCLLSSTTIKREVTQGRTPSCSGLVTNLCTEVEIHVSDAVGFCVTIQQVGSLGLGCDVACGVESPVDTAD